MKIKSGFHWLWQRIQQHLYIATGCIVVLIAFVFLVLLFGWNWTGFNGGESKITITSTSKGTTTTTELQTAKRLWDWLGLLATLAIPVVVGLGAAWFTTQQAKVSDAANKQQHETELQITTDNQREAALQVYIDKISELLLKEKGLRESRPEDEIRTITRVRTLTVLHRLDTMRKASVLQFLHESSLIDKNKLIINLNGANLSGADLSYATLSEVNLIKTNLSEASLFCATLSEAHLFWANLSDANLSKADLSGAHLFQANLSKAHLRVAILNRANLKDATGITTKELEKHAKSLKDATMPDGSIHS